MKTMEIVRAVAIEIRIAKLNSLTKVNRGLRTLAEMLKVGDFLKQRTFELGDFRQ